MTRPPAAERALGLGAYLTDAAGMGGHLRERPEDFVVIEAGDGPRRGEGKHTAARIRLRNWETNRFAMRAARELGIRPQQVAFQGMKDKRAVTEQWFTFQCPPDRLERLAGLEDVDVLDAYATPKRAYTGGHGGNTFIIRIRGHGEDAEALPRLQDVAQTITRAGGVPNYFGPQRFGGHRPITHLVGKALVADDLEEAVRLYLGNPVAGEDEEVHEARSHYEATRDAEATLALAPKSMDIERRMLRHLVERPEDWRGALATMQGNLLQLFVHAWQSFLFNRILTARLAEGLGLGIQEGDLVVAPGEERTHLVTSFNLERVRRECVKGRAHPTGPLMGHATDVAAGVPGEIEARILGEEDIEADGFRMPQWPQLASKGLRRSLVQPVHDLDVTWDTDPVFRFCLGKGGYATVVLREFMKSDLA